MGDSKFALTVFDSLCADHFHEIDGTLMLEEFAEPTDGSFMLDLSSISGTLIEGNCFIILLVKH